MDGFFSAFLDISVKIIACVGVVLTLAVIVGLIFEDPIRKLLGKERK